jgi:hypothetical protein
VRRTVDHELGRVGIVGADDSLSGKVLLHNGGLLSQVTKVYSVCLRRRLHDISIQNASKPEKAKAKLTSTSSEKQESVELLKEKCGRLVDGDEHRLSGVRKLSEESEDVERGLTVETGGGLKEGKDKEERANISQERSSGVSQMEGGRRTSSRKSKTGLATSSQPMVRRFRASTPSPTLFSPMMAFWISVNSRRSMTLST